MFSYENSCRNSFFERKNILNISQGTFISVRKVFPCEVNVLFEGHKVVKKNFETEMRVDGKVLPLNHMMQETIANVMLGFSKTLKGLDLAPETIEVKIQKLPQPKEVDAHTYP